MVLAFSDGRDESADEESLAADPFEPAVDLGAGYPAQNRLQDLVQAESAGGAAWHGLTVAGDWAGAHRGTIVTVAASAGCLVPAVGWVACAGLQAVAYGFRTQQTVSEKFGLSMNVVLRSWFWNAVLVAVLVVMASLLTAVAVSGIDSGSMITAVIFGVGAVAFWIATVRAVRLGVVIRSDRIVARGLERTTVILWDEMESVETEGLINGAASLGGSITPVVYWKRPQDAKTRRTELNMIGGYVLGSRRPTRMERNATEIEKQLSQWREQKTREPM